MNTYTLDAFGLFGMAVFWAMVGWMWGRRR